MVSLEMERKINLADPCPPSNNRSLVRKSKMKVSLNETGRIFFFFFMDAKPPSRAAPDRDGSEPPLLIHLILTSVKKAVYHRVSDHP